MADTITGLALVSEMAVLIGIIALYDPSHYVKQKRNSEDDWYPRIEAAFSTADAKNLLTNPDYTKIQALVDSDGSSAYLFTRMGIDTVAPIVQAQTTANGYNSTSALMAMNDSYGTVAATATKNKLAAISAYGQISQNNFNTEVNMLGIGKGTQSVTTVSSSPFGIDVSSLLGKIQEGVGQYVGSVNASVDIMGSIGSFFGL